MSSLNVSTVTEQAPVILESSQDASRDVGLVEALQTAVKLGGSDLHVTAGLPPMVRVSGSLQPVPGALPWSDQEVLREVMQSLSNEQRTEFENHHELDLALTVPRYSRESPGIDDEMIRFRANVYLQRGSVAAAFRHIPEKIRTLRELGMPHALAKLTQLPRGLVLVTGPTGSGKSTTLAAMIDAINHTRSAHIMTVEDPIEFVHKHHSCIINQREVGQDTESYGKALRQVLRQDPDVILIGEMRDLETISVALTAAETGHLVFATLHTQSASQTVDRIIDVFPPHQQSQVRTQLAATLKGVVTQTLVPRLEGSGRAAATEVLVSTPAVANLIREAQTYQLPATMQAGAAYGMHTLDQDLARLVNEGIVAHQAAEQHAIDRDALRQLVRRTDASVGENEPVDIDFGDAFSRGGRRR